MTVVQLGNPLSYSISGGLGLGQSPAVFNEMQELLPKMLGRHEKRLAVLGSPYAGAGFSFPLTLTEKENGYDVTSRILRCWVRLNEFNCKKLIPAVKEGKIVFMLRYGLDAVIYTGAACGCPELLADIEVAHHALVHARVVDKKIPPPRYIVPWLQPSMIDKVVTDERIARTKALRGSKTDEVRTFIGSEQELISRYCSKENGQRTPWKLNGAHDASQMAEQAVHLIVEDVERRLAAA